MNRGHRIVFNAATQLASQPFTWALTLIFAVIVPRNVGPGEWGEWTIAWAVGGLAKLLLDFGSDTVLFKRVARDPHDSQSTLGAVSTLRLGFAPVLVLIMIGFSYVARYSAHTRLVVAIVAVAVAAAYLARPAIFALQALEKMHLTAITGVLTGLVQTLGALIMLKFFFLGLISISVLFVVAQIIGLVLLWVLLARAVPTRPNLNMHLVGQVIREGVPYWSTAGFITVYVWLDGLLLSLLGATHENGWYGVATQLVATLGFVPSAVSTAVFPTLSRSATDRAESAGVTTRSLRLLVTLSLPMAVGLALTAGNLVPLIYGGWYEPAGQTLAVLALTLPPVFVATLVSTWLIAADRQLQWTWVMAGVCGLNLVLNLFTIPYFHAHQGNGALGAAVALLATDLASGVIAVVLLPPALRAAVRATWRPIIASLVATLIMAGAVWPLRSLFILIPVLVGALVFTLAALLLRVFAEDELSFVARLPRAAVTRLTRVPEG